MKKPKNSYIYYENTDDGQREVKVNGKNALSAAKKLWKQKKHLTKFTLYDDKGTSYKFDSNSWSINGKFRK